MKYSVILPTLNEAENIKDIVPAIFAAMPDGELEIWIVDEHSSDGTLDVARELAKQYPARLFPLENPGPKSLSASVISGFERAHGEFLLCMDADGQHRPCDLPNLFHALENGADFVIGSRYTAGGGFAEKWNLLRVVMSRSAAWMASFMLGTSVLDPMSGFFGVKRATFHAIRSALAPNGFKIMLEMLYLLSLRKQKICVQECPILFEMRKKGKSKLSGRIIFQYLAMLMECRRNREKNSATVNAGTEPQA